MRRLAPDGLEAWKQLIERGYEGLVAKGRGERVRSRTDEAAAEGEAEGMDHRGGQMAPAAQRGAAGSVDRRSRKRMACGTLPAVSLLTELNSFYLEHDRPVCICRATSTPIDHAEEPSDVKFAIHA